MKICRHFYGSEINIAIENALFNGSNLSVIFQDLDWHHGCFIKI